MTDTQIQNISTTKKKISITVPKDKITAFLNQAYQKVSKSAKINGFRPGKIPNNVLDKHYGAQIEYECLNDIISETYTLALTSNKLIPMTEPKFDTKPLDRNSDYSYSVEIEVKPEFELKDYKGIEIKKQQAEVTNDELGAELKRLQESLAQLAPTTDDTTLAKGLVATIDFEGTLDGQPFQGGTAKDYVFEFGSGQLLEQFESGIAGAKKGETRQIQMTFPQDYFEKALAGKPAEYKITLKNLHNKTLPELDNEMAKDIGKESIDDVKKELSDSILKRKERGFRGDYVNAVKTTLAKAYNFEIPESLVASEVERTKKEKAEVEESIKIELILEAIAIKENIKATQQDVEQQMAVFAQVYRQPVQEIRKLYQKNNMIGMLAAQIALDKTLDFLIENAKMV